MKRLATFILFATAILASHAETREDVCNRTGVVAQAIASARDAGVKEERARVVVMRDTADTPAARKWAEREVLWVYGNAFFTPTEVRGMRFNACMVRLLAVR